MCSCGSLSASGAENDAYDRWLESPKGMDAPEGFTYRMKVDDCIGKLGACRGYIGGERLLGLMEDIEELTDRLASEVFDES